jgi:hypothetical protein
MLKLQLAHKQSLNDNVKYEVEQFGVNVLALERKIELIKVTLD